MLGERSEEPATFGERDERLGRHERRSFVHVSLVALNWGASFQVSAREWGDTHSYFRSFHFHFFFHLINFKQDFVSQTVISKSSIFSSYFMPLLRRLVQVGKCRCMKVSKEERGGGERMRLWTEGEMEDVRGCFQPRAVEIPFNPVK